jgi:CRP-like cAMP-binding protein
MNDLTISAREFLRLVPSARRLSTEDLQSLLSRLIPIQVPPGAVLFVSGEEPDAAYLIVSGEVRVVRDLPGGETQTLAKMGRGDVVGDMGLIDRCARSATARVESELSALRLDIAVYRQFKIDAHPAADWLLEEIDRRLALRIRTMFDRISRVREEPALATSIPKHEATSQPWYSRFWRLGTR